MIGDGGGRAVRVCGASWGECGGIGRKDGRGQIKIPNLGDGERVPVRRTVPWYSVVTVLALNMAAVQP